MGAGRTAMTRLAAIVVALAAAAGSVQPAAALLCAREWGSDTFVGARQAVAHAGRWDGLLVGTVSVVERRDDYWRTRVLTVEPGVIFSGELRDTLRVEIGGNGPEMGFAEGATYFLALTRSSNLGSSEWFVHPCGPNMQLTSSDQLAQLRTITDSEIVILEPVIRGTPAALPVAFAAGLAALGALWVIRRATRRPLEANL